VLHVKIEISALKKAGEYNLWLLTRARKQERIYNGDECKIGESVLNTISDSNFQSLLHFRKSAIKELP